MEKNKNNQFFNKDIPPDIRKEVEFALSHYPELEGNPIDFVFSERIRKSFMQAQPQWKGIFQHSRHRAYKIKITPVYQFEEESIPIDELPRDVVIGWLAHELGHLMDYRQRTGLSLLFFGLGYITSRKFLMEAERVADTEAVNHGLGDYILATKHFIINHAQIPESYKQRIDRLYMSPDAVMEVIAKRKLDLPEEKLDTAATGT